MIKLQDCSLKFVQPRNIADAKTSHELRAAHATWSSVWGSTFKEFGSKEVLYSDGLTRQDEVMAIFHGIVCVGILCLRWLDFSKFDWSTDSYFKVWNDEDITKLRAHGERIMISTYLSVHESYRAKQVGFSFRDVILDLMVQRFLLTAGDSISGITRREKHVHSTCYDLGATKIREDIPYQNDRDRVDLLVFYRKDLKLLTDPVIREWSDGLFGGYLSREEALPLRKAA